MKLKHIVSALVAVVLAVGVANSYAGKSEAELLKDAKITKEEAIKIALEKVPGGKIKEAELEEENGKLIWSFDIKTKGTKSITEVNIDAKTGEVIAVDVETPKDEKKEADDEKKEKKEKHEKKEKDDDDKK